MFLLLTSSALSVEQLRCRLAADYQTPHLCSLSDVSPLSQMHNNLPTHAGIFFHFRVMARSVTSQGRGCASSMTITPWIAWQGGTADSQPRRFCAVLHHQHTTNAELARQECSCSFDKHFQETDFYEYHHRVKTLSTLRIFFACVAMRTAITVATSFVKERHDTFFSYRSETHFLFCTHRCVRISSTWFNEL